MEVGIKKYLKQFRKWLIQKVLKVKSYELKEPVTHQYNIRPQQVFGFDIIDIVDIIEIDKREIESSRLNHIEYFIEHVKNQSHQRLLKKLKEDNLIEFKYVDMINPAHYGEIIKIQSKIKVLKPNNK